MFNRNQYDRISLCFAKFLLHISQGITVVGDAVSKSIFKIIGRYNDDAYINPTVLEIVAYVNDIASQQIASARHLDLHADPRNNCLVVTEPFCPIHIA